MQSFHVMNGPPICEKFVSITAFVSVLHSCACHGNCVLSLTFTHVDTWCPFQWFFPFGGNQLHHAVYRQYLRFVAASFSPTYIDFYLLHHVFVHGHFTPSSRTKPFAESLVVIKMWPGVPIKCSNPDHIIYLDSPHINVPFQVSG